MDDILRNSDQPPRHAMSSTRAGVSSRRLKVEDNRSRASDNRRGVKTRSNRVNKNDTNEGESLSSNASRIGVSQGLRQPRPIDFSDVLTSSSDEEATGSDEENDASRARGAKLSARDYPLGDGGAAKDPTRRPLRELAPKDFDSNAAAPRGITKEDLYDLSQALSSLSVSRGADSCGLESQASHSDGAARGGKRAESLEDCKEDEDSSFEFPLYGSPTRPGEG